MQSSIEFFMYTFVYENRAHNLLLGTAGEPSTGYLRNKSIKYYRMFCAHNS